VLFELVAHDMSESTGSVNRADFTRASIR
jgi:hypothetical protein